MLGKNQELTDIIKEFAEMGWDVLDGPAKEWLSVKDDCAKLKEATPALAAAIEKADAECGSCGCDCDPKYKKALELLRVA
ncbi:MAG: hypothetical protein FWE91_00750 [Defluviitaleaceae bacterium]|nr:hypothetical protein [Defluviitaleaceae bacterium]MCL2835423.1 hypothetical protein [Defluviitaleaceae bacterium]